MKKLSVAFLTLVLVSACGGGSGGSSSGGAGGGNSAPLITSGNTFSVAEGSTSIGTVSATDADGDNLTFTLSGVDAGAISIGSSSGALSFNAPADYENPADDGADNVYNVTVRVGDGSAFDARDLVITVTNNNDAPVISSGGSYTVTENVTVIGSVDATDADGDTLTYTLSGDDASLMTVSSTGALSFVSAPDFETPGDADANNVYEATVTVTDGTDQATQAINVTVTDLEEAVNATELFISEYSEGSSNNKYIEIFNGTGASVSLDGYAWPTNAAPSAEEGKHEYWNTFTEGAVIANNDVYVVCNGSLDASVSAACDQTGSVFFNGDDGVALAKGTEESFTVVDVVGTWSATDPGVGYEVCGVADGTLNHTLIKKEKVEGNAGDWASSAGTSAEDCDWIVKDQNYWSDIGLHCWDSEYAADSIVINNASGALSVAENGTSVATVSTTVSACGSVAFSLTGDDKDLFTVSETGVVEFVSAPDYENPADMGADNVYNFTVVATNGSASDSLAMIVTVTDVDEDIPTYSGQVYFSEAAEGSSNNKYLEIFNGTTGTINLNDYAFPNVSNDPDTAGVYEYWNTFTADATLGKGQVWVVCHPSADDLIKAECDQEFTYLSNGDDGFKLVQGTEASFTVLDTIGNYQGDPGDGWDVCGTVAATKDHTLVKKSNKYGTDDWSVSAGTNADDCYWEVKAQDVWDGVGAHTEIDATAADFSEAFGGATIDGTTYTFPTGAEGWAGFANMNTDLYPISMPNGGTVTFTAAVPAGGSAEVYFRFEKNPYPDTEPSVNSANVTITGAEEATYTVDIDAQGENTFSSFLLYVATRDVGVTVKNVKVTQKEPEVDTSVAVFSEAFGGATIDGTTYTFPTGAETWAGFANMNTDLYPISMPNGGTVTFTAAVPAGGTAEVYYRFEKNPYPDTEPSVNSANVTITGAEEATYSVDIDAQGENTFSSFLLYVVTQDVGVTIKNVKVTAAAAPEGVVMDMSGTFGGVGYNAETNGFTFPSSAEVWGGWAHNADSGTDMYPFTFTEAGKVIFKASAPNGDVVVKFKFEKNPYPDTTPEFFTDTVTVTGADEATYEVAVPAQGENTFSSFLMYFETSDVEIYISEVRVVADAADDSGGGDSGTTTASGGGTMSMIEAFGGATVDGTTYTFPTGAEPWAGFAHDPNADNSAIYPIVMPNGGTIVANMNGASSDVTIFFKFEKDAYPNTTPDYQTANITVTAGAASDYTIEVPSQGENTFKNFLMYIVERDTPLVLNSVVVTPTQ